MGYEGSNHIALATAIEFMHTATLLHDDVVDESNLRRGKKTACSIWGNQASVLVGDFLLGKAFKIMVNVGDLVILDILSSASAIIAEGEVMQLVATQNIETSQDDYFSIIKAKTATLFAAATEIGAILNHQPSLRESLHIYGLNLGLAFQIVDDILDYGGNSKNLGKNIGDDFREGKITLPVILSYQASNAQEKQFWQNTMNNPQLNADDFAQAQSLIQKHQALQLSMTHAHYFAQNALRGLEKLPNSPYKNALAETVSFCISRIQ